MYYIIAIMFYTIVMLRCYLQKRVLNVSRGPAVRALRAQTDKREYAMEMKKIVERQVLFTFMHHILGAIFLLKMELLSYVLARDFSLKQ